jgi:prolipoprotein diacylglyceryl transferase
LFTRFFKLEKIPIEVLDRLTIYVAIGTVAGARLGHCLFYEPSYYLQNPLEILKIWHGGLASHGAAIGIPTAIYLFAKKERKTFLWGMDRVVIVVALAGFFIRMGNLMNSEIYGNVTDVPWGFIFMRDKQFEPRHPTQIYESLVYLFIFFLLLHLYYKNSGKPREGLLFSIFLILVFTSRFFIEFIKKEQVTFEENMVLNMGQILSIPLIIIGVVLLWKCFTHPPAPVKKTVR